MLSCYPLTTMQEKPDLPKIVSGLAFVLLVALGVWLLVASPKDNTSPNQIIREAQNEPIPPNARAIDAFVFADDKDVYLKSIHGTSTTKIPQADPDTFVPVGGIREYGPQEVLDFCKGPGIYGMYKDSRKVYFFQAWKTEAFAKTKIQVVKELDAGTLSATEGGYTDAQHSVVSIGHTFATTTCSLSLQGL